MHLKQAGACIGTRLDAATSTKEQRMAINEISEIHFAYEAGKIIEMIWKPRADGLVLPNFRFRKVPGVEAKWDFENADYRISADTTRDPRVEQGL